MDDLFEFSAQQGSQTHSVERMRELEAVIAGHDLAYYQSGEPTISDHEYDKLYRELEELELKFPEEKSAHSPTQRVGNDLLESFENKPHLLPMLSIDDVFSEEELSAFWKRLEKLTGDEKIPVSIEPKIDGVAVSLVYREGKLDYALTRGDGKSGDDVTDNVKTIRGIPLTLAMETPPALMEVRGEIYIGKRDFEALNHKREEEGKALFANPRNSTAGTIKLLDSREVAKRPLSFIAHGIGSYEGVSLSSEAEFRTYLKAWNIPLNEPVFSATTFEEVWEAVNKLDQIRHELPHMTDGAVIKVESFEERQNLGVTARAPRWAAAFKFPPEQKETQIESIEVQVGRTGVLTPVANLKPVHVSGTTVSRATLHNQDEIDRKDVRVGDTVLIEKAGEIIPSVVKVLYEKRPEGAEPFKISEYLNNECPACQQPIAQEEGQVAWRCVNFSCEAKMADRLAHFASRKALDLASMGGAVSESLVARGYVRSPIELFTLDLESLGNLNLGSDENPRTYGVKNATKLINSLEKAKASIPLSRWIYGLGIPNVGESGALELARLHQDFSELVASEIVSRIASFEKAGQKQKDEMLAPFNISGDLGPVSAKSILTYFQSAEGVDFIRVMNELEINPQSDNYRPKLEEGEALPLAGKRMVITGSFDVGRGEVKAFIQGLGGSVSGAVSSKTSLLISGSGGGSKRVKAESLGVEIVDFESFEDIKAHFSS